MKQALRTLFSFILTPLEAGDDPYAIKPSHRLVLKAIGVLFSLLAFVVAVIVFKAAKADDLFGYLLPAVVFFCVGFTAIVVGSLGNDRAVAKIWGSK